MDLGSRIAAWLRAKGMTQRQLATAIEMSPAAVTTWVRAQCSPSQRSLEAIVGALGLTMEKFYGAVPTAKAKRAA